MKAVIISPYLKTLGGGERYALTFAEALLKKGWEVDVTVKDRETINEAAKRFNLFLDNVGNRRDDDFIKGTIFSKYFLQRKYDLLFWVSDGSVPLMFGRKNLLHFQIPFHGIQGKNLLNNLKLRFIDKVVCNSKFTKVIIDREYGINSDVWYPPVSVEEFVPEVKEKYILAVGRFEKSQTEKKQDVLIEAFKKMVKAGLKNWKLVLAGGSTGGVENSEILSKLEKTAKDFPIDFKINVSFPELKSLYSKAKIFWHAAGFGIEEDEFPEKTEHFGITTVEAMAAGCVPIVIKKGGQKEIVEDNKNGFLWETEEELISLTFKTIENSRMCDVMSKEAIRRSRNFSKEKFYEKIYNFIEE